MQPGTILVIMVPTGENSHSYWVQGYATTNDRNKARTWKTNNAALRNLAKCPFPMAFISEK